MIYLCVFKVYVALSNAKAREFLEKREVLPRAIKSASFFYIIDQN
jgi:hypothetical protein